jgi:hypothetical protein
MILNLSLISLICYYFKKKFDSIEEVQQEQSKILYDLVNKDNKNIDPLFMNMSAPSNNVTSLEDIVNDKSYSNVTDDNNDIKTILTGDNMFNVDISIKEDKSEFDFKDEEEDEDSDEDSDEEEEDDEEDDEDEESDEEEEEEEDDHNEVMENEITQTNKMEEDFNTELNIQTKDESIVSSPDTLLEVDDIFDGSYDGDEEDDDSTVVDNKDDLDSNQVDIKEITMVTTDLEKKTVDELRNVIKMRTNNNDDITNSKLKKMKKKELIDFISNINN